MFNDKTNVLFIIIKFHQFMLNPKTNSYLMHPITLWIFRLIEIWEKITFLNIKYQTMYPLYGSLEVMEF